MPASEETGSGPVIHDHRRIDPVTGQVRGKHAASKPAGTRGAGRPAAAPEAGGTKAGDPAGDQPEDKHDKHEERDVAATQESPEEASEMVTGQVIKDGRQAADVAAQLAERTAEIGRASCRERAEIAGV